MQHLYFIVFFGVIDEVEWKRGVYMKRQNVEGYDEGNRFYVSFYGP